MMQPSKTRSDEDRTRLQGRLDKAQEIARRARLDFIALVPGSTLFYLTGVSFHLMERPTVLFIPAEGDPAMVIPSLEISKMTDATPFPIRLFGYTDAEGYSTAFDKISQALGLSGKKVGVEGLRMRVLEGHSLRRAARGCEVMSADDTLAALRLHKDKGEIAAMRTAIEISQKALDVTIAKVRPGMTERQIAAMLASAMTEAGSGGNAFDAIVLSGPNSALPHGGPKDRAVQEGEMLLFDFGATFNAYLADITRTFFVGEPSSDWTNIYNTVLAANEAGIRAAAPGVSAQDVDRAARKVITDAGFGEYFIHRTGHGLGLDGHEEPYIREGNEQLLEPGMVFTVEPGIYLPGKGGVRIEDDVLITDKDAEVLTSYPKTLRVIGR